MVSGTNPNTALPVMLVQEGCYNAPEVCNTSCKVSIIVGTPSILFPLSRELFYINALSVYKRRKQLCRFHRKRKWLTRLVKFFGLKVLRTFNKFNAFNFPRTTYLFQSRLPLHEHSGNFFPQWCSQSFDCNRNNICFHFFPLFRFTVSRETILY